MNDNDMVDAVRRLWGSLKAPPVKTDVVRTAVDRLTVNDFWRGPRGNAKARRRWRRRDVSNTQREADRRTVAGEQRAWEVEVYGK